MAGESESQSGLRRVLTLWPLVFYGLGVIVGAGIYVAIGEVIARAGDAAPLSFLLAGIAAAATGLCYAELASRMPEAGGAATYVAAGFGSPLAGRLVGAAITAATAVSAASIAHGAVHYLAVLVPVPEPALIALVIVGFTAVAAIGVRESVGIAATIGALEIAGLVVATAAGLLAAPEFHFAGMVPHDGAAWRGTAAGAFIAFFAFIGFETLANMAEEVKEPRRTVPLGIVGAVAASMVLYVAVAAAAVLGDAAAGMPLLGLFGGGGATVFAMVGFLAVANGVLVEIVMLARLFYGMARKGQLPAWLGRVNARTRTPVEATLLVGAIALAAALLVPFERLLVLADALTLGVFAAVDLALWRLQRGAAAAGSFRVPHWLPPAAALLALALIAAEFLNA